ncbi:hypothetical protein SAMN02910265_00605 [Ruminococcus flavefaciens]|uniref:Lipoprotein n=1 Tax=Ruminococcus flavefaciens TaxID=1265 RepID=A0A1H6I6X2_RUMFL|nr:hypothetical protein [Ruminococcus flavefaciens]SEH42451.1 hypothetical protein SAMN02910265_00605 [Ruminococcus flavefaciens]
MSLKRSLFIPLLLAASLCSCGAQKESASSDADTSAKSEAAVAVNGYDVDLTELNSQMVYAQVYDMVSNPDNYMGQKIRVKGPFSYFKDDQTGNEYFAVLISDATACCSQGIEFVLDGEHKYPDDYPALDSEITVSGTFNYYKEGVNLYCQLLDAKIEDNKLSW